MNSIKFIFDVLIFSYILHGNILLMWYLDDEGKMRSCRWTNPVWLVSLEEGIRCQLTQRKDCRKTWGDTTVSKPRREDPQESTLTTPSSWTQRNAFLSFKPLAWHLALSPQKTNIISISKSTNICFALLQSFSKLAILHHYVLLRC